MAPLRIAVIGAAGETGTSIINGLLDDGSFSIVALTRPSSVSKPINKAMAERGIEIVPADITGSEDELVKILQGIDVLVSAVGAESQLDQIPLATAAKKAGVKRFFPCGAITVAPPEGVMVLRDLKEKVYNHIKKIQLPYTIVDVGWWYQISYPRLPSGKTDYATPVHFNTLIGDGNTPSALTDLRDIGRYFAKLVCDDRTINKYVLVYNEVWKPNDVYDLVEKVSGEKVERKPLSANDLQTQMGEHEAVLEKDPANIMAYMGKIQTQYQISWGARGDNTPEYAKYLGYVTSKDLYPDLEYTKFETFLSELLEGKIKSVYDRMRQ